MSEYKIGERVKVLVPIVKHKEIEVEVCEGDSVTDDCEKCAFYNYDSVCRGMKCVGAKRLDRKDVYFNRLK